MMTESSVTLSVATRAVALLTARGPASRAARPTARPTATRAVAQLTARGKTPPLVLPVHTSPQTHTPALPALPCTAQLQGRWRNSPREAKPRLPCCPYSPHLKPLPCLHYPALRNTRPDTTRRLLAVGRHWPMTRTVGNNAAKKKQVHESYWVITAFHSVSWLPLPIAFESGQACEQE